MLVVCSTFSSNEKACYQIKNDLAGITDFGRLGCWREVPGDSGVLERELERGWSYPGRTDNCPARINWEADQAYQRLGLRESIDPGPRDVHR